MYQQRGEEYSAWEHTERTSLENSTLSAQECDEEMNRRYAAMIKESWEGLDDRAGEMRRVVDMVSRQAQEMGRSMEA